MFGVKNAWITAHARCCAEAEPALELWLAKQRPMAAGRGPRLACWSKGGTS